MHQPSYTRLTNHDRESISQGLARGDSVTKIAKQLGRATSTVSREVNQKSGITGYRACSASQRAKRAATSRRQGKRRLNTHSPLRRYVLKKLQLRWSPEEIVKHVEIEYPADMTMRISHEVIYQYIYVLPRGELKRTLIQALRQERKHRRPKQKQSTEQEHRGKIAHMLSIDERPAEVADRYHPGSLGR